MTFELGLALVSLTLVATGCQRREPPSNQQVCEHVLSINQRELPEQLSGLTAEQLAQSVETCVAELDARATVLGPTMHAKVNMCLMVATDLDSLASCDPEDF